MVTVDKETMEMKGLHLSPSSMFWYYKGNFYISPNGQMQRRQLVGLVQEASKELISLGYGEIPSPIYVGTTYVDYVMIDEPKAVKRLQKKLKKFINKSYVIKFLFQANMFLRSFSLNSGSDKIWHETTSRINDALKTNMAQGTSYVNILCKYGNKCTLKGIDCAVDDVQDPKTSRFDLMEMEE